MRTATSASSSVTMSGGASRIELSPQPSRSRPRSNAALRIGIHELFRRGAGLAVLHEVDREHEPEAACVADDPVLRLQLLETSEEVRPHLRGVRGEPFLKKIESGERGSAGDGVSAIGASMAARAPLKELVAGDDRREGHPRGDALREDDDVGVEIEMLGGEELPGAPHPRLDLVGDEEDPVLVGEGSKLREEFLLGDEVAALPLDRLHDDGRDLFRRGDALEKRLLQVVEAFDVAGLGRLAHRTSIALRVVRVVHLGEHGTVALPLHRLARGEGHRAHRSSMKCPEEGDDLLPLGPEPRELDRGLDRFRPGIGEEDPWAASATPDGRHLREPLRELRDRPGVEVRRTHVEELSRLLADGGDDPRMAMARRADGDARGEVEEAVPVGVGHHHPRGLLDHQGIVLLEVLGDEALVLLDERFRLRPGKLGHDRGCSEGGHGFSSEKVSSRRRDDVVELPLLDDEGRAQHHGVAVDAVRHARSIINDEPLRERPGGDLLDELPRPGKGLLRSLVAHELDSREEAATADVPHEVEPLQSFEGGEERPLEPGHAGHEILALEDREHFPGDGGHDRMVGEREPVGEATELLFEGPGDTLPHRDRPSRNRARGDALSQEQDVGNDARRPAGEKRPRAPVADQDLVDDEEDVVPIADFADPREVVGRGNVRSGRGATHGLDEERRNGLRADFLDEVVERVRASDAAVGMAFLQRTAIAVGRRGVMMVRKKRKVGLPERLPSGDREGSERPPVIARAHGERPELGFFPPREVILPRELDRRLRRFASPRDEIELRELPGKKTRETLGPLLDGVGRELRPVDVGDFLRLLRHRAREVLPAVAEAHDQSPAAGVEVAFSRGVEEVDPLAPDRRREDLPQVPVEHRSFGESPLRPCWIKLTPRRVSDAIVCIRLGYRGAARFAKARRLRVASTA